MQSIKSNKQSLFTIRRREHEHSIKNFKSFYKFETNLYSIPYAHLG